MAYTTFSNAEWQDGRRAMVLYDVHRLLLKEHQQLETRMKRLASQGPLSEENARAPSPGASFYEVLAREYAYSIDRIRGHRARMSREDLLLPELPPGFASLLHETDSGNQLLLPLDLPPTKNE